MASTTHLFCLLLSMPGVTPAQTSIPQVGLVNPVLATPIAMANLLASGAKRKDEEESGQQEALQDGALEALSEEDLSISGSSARRMVMRKLLRKQEVRVLMRRGLPLAGAGQKLLMCSEHSDWTGWIWDARFSWGSVDGNDILR